MAGDAKETGSANLVPAFQVPAVEEKWMWKHGRRSESGGKTRSRFLTCLHSFSENPEIRWLRSCVVVSLAA